jgi:hypothetical protein
MVETNRRGHEMRSTMLTLAMILGGGWTIYTYWTSAGMAGKKPLLEKRLDVYLEAVDLAGKIANTSAIIEATGPLEKKQFSGHSGGRAEKAFPGIGVRSIGTCL